jgi:hypothetical protein
MRDHVALVEGPGRAASGGGIAPLVGHVSWTWRPSGASPSSQGPVRLGRVDVAGQIEQEPGAIGVKLQQGAVGNAGSVGGCPRVCEALAELLESIGFGRGGSGHGGVVNVGDEVHALHSC